MTNQQSTFKENQQRLHRLAVFVPSVLLMAVAVGMATAYGQSGYVSTAALFAGLMPWIVAQAARRWWSPELGAVPKRLLALMSMLFWIIGIWTAMSIENITFDTYWRGQALKAINFLVETMTTVNPELAK